MPEPFQLPAVTIIKATELLTSLELFEDHEYKEGRKFKIIENGRLFNEDAKEALVGAFAADKLGLKVGDSFQPYHGLTYIEGAQHADVYKVTGILETTSTPVDRVIWIPIKGIQTMRDTVRISRTTFLHSLSSLGPKRRSLFLIPV